MTKVYTLAFLLLFAAVSAKAQSTSLATDTVVLDVTYTGQADIYQEDTYLRNETNDTLTIIWTVFDPAQTLVNGWFNGFCNDDLCTDLAFVTTGKFSLPANDSVAVKAQIGPNNIDGNTLWSVELTDSANTASKDTVYFDIKMLRDVTSIKDVSDETFSIYPNPVTETINISDVRNASSIDGYEIYNVIGKLAKAGTYSSSINVAGLDNGFYLLKLVDKEGNRQLTRSFIKK